MVVCLVRDGSTQVLRRVPPIAGAKHLAFPDNGSRDGVGTQIADRTFARSEGVTGGRARRIPMVLGRDARSIATAATAGGPEETFFLRGPSHDTPGR